MSNAIVTATANTTALTNANAGLSTSPIITTSEMQYSSLFPTSQWEWNERGVLWDGVGTNFDISHELTTETVASLAGLDFGFVTSPLYDQNGREVPLIAVERDDNFAFLGSGSKRFTPIGNEQMLEVCEALRQMGFKYVNAGVFDFGKVTYVSMKWKDETVSGEEMSYYVVVVNSFDGTKPLGVYITPIRVWCKNTLRLAIAKAKAFWKIKHTVTATNRIAEAKEGLQYFSDVYLNGFNREMDQLKLQRMTRDGVDDFIKMLIPLTDNATQRQITSVERQRAELMYRYQYAPDLDGMEDSAFRMICAISDYTDHREPMRRTSNWQSKRFENSLNGNKLLDTGLKMLDDMRL